MKRTFIHLKETTQVPDTKSMVPLSDTLRRVVRTFFQAFTGSLVAALPIVVATTDASVLVQTLEGLALAAVFSGATATVALVHNLLEDSGTVPSTK